MMETEAIGLYVHIPFCKSKCAYCDFCSFSGMLDEYEERYVSALLSEIKSYKREEKIKIDSLFFGGGTPSIISIESFLKIVGAIRDSFSILENAEFTIEANPKTVSGDKIKAYVDAGVNRISLGLQSIHKKELKSLGRIHTFEEFVESFYLCRTNGISNINVDIMYGLPGQTRDSFAETVNRVVSLCPEHISSYGLILEPGTPLFECKDSLTFPDEDTECEMYFDSLEILKNHGYVHYEISNYAKEGFQCKHNLKYWNCKEYIGLGLSAHSYLGRKRFFNTDSFQEYFSKEKKEYFTEAYISKEDEAFEFAMMNLRLSCGFSLSDYEKRFGASFIKGKEDFIENLALEGLIICNNGRIRLTDKGFYVSNSILSSLL